VSLPVGPSLNPMKIAAKKSLIILVHLVGYMTFQHEIPISSIISALIVLSVLMIASEIPYVQADNFNPGVYAKDSKVYGITYSDWTSKWWQWLIASPLPVNPANDNSGKNCAQKQTGQVWFLAGASSGKADRTCTIPSGRAILFPITTSECSYVEYPAYKTETDLRKCAVSEENKISKVEATVDGRNINNLQNYRQVTSLFDLIFPKDNFFGVPAGPSKAVSDGHWVFLQPLSVGNHEIKFKGVSFDYTSTGSGGFAQDITYHLVVG
jgi:hypothetical protein